MNVTQTREGTPGLAAQMVGTWLCRSLDARTDAGVPFDAFGDDLRGMLVLDEHRHFAVILLGGRRRRLASGNRLAGTPGEYQAMGEGTIAYFGTWSVDESARMLTLHVAACSFANWDRTDQVRSIALDGDVLVLASPATAAGGSAVVTWVRLPQLSERTT